MIYWSLILIPILLLGLIWLTEVHLLYPRHRRIGELPDNLEHTPEDITFYTKDGVALHGWWFEHPNATGSLIFCHGNAGNLSSRGWVARDLQDLPINVFLFDYRGYGKSKGFPSERGTGKDVLAAYDFTHARSNGLPVIACGRSLGGGTSLQLAEQVSLDGLIIESSFTSVLDMAKRFYPWLLPTLTCRNRYASVERLRKLSLPVLIAHSPDDEVVPYDMGQALSQAAPNLWRFCVLEGRHNEAGWQTSPAYARAVREYITERLHAAKKPAM